VTIDIAAPTGDASSVVPAGRRYLLQLRIDRTASVRLDGVGELPKIDGGGDRPGWWEDGHGFTWVRLPAQLAATVVLRTAT